MLKYIEFVDLIFSKSGEFSGLIISNRKKLIFKFWTGKGGQFFIGFRIIFPFEVWGKSVVKEMCHAFILEHPLTWLMSNVSTWYFGRRNFSVRICKK